MKGFRGLGIIAITWLLMLADTFASQITSLSLESLRAAFIASLPITIKLILVDARPRIMEFFK